ncbi:MAG: fused MFS/spermidine synthase [Actinobacteria bacterium]|nr:fused MFS/spermidine synthase [Actinomycetota bacterium]
MLVVLLFAVASFVSAGLLFMVQPMVAKLVLPTFGGSPAVWNTSMLFFQTVLLAGYSYAHFSTRWLGLRRQTVVHVAALAAPLLVLPVALPVEAFPPDGVMPAVWLLYVLAVMVGAPFLLVSTSAPLLQLWYSATDHHRAGDPYFLYAAGNSGSLLALLAYPFLIEPTLSLPTQTRLWSAGYAIFVVLALACVATVHRRRAVASEPGTPAGGDAPSGVASVGRRRQLTWVMLAFLPSSLMLGLTQFVSTDIAAFPLLWVVPLSVYLLSFIVAFAQRRPRVALAAGRVLPAATLAIAVTMIPGLTFPAGFEITLHLLFFTTVALVAHGRLADDRPPPARLTHFYLLVSIGGALGGVFNGLLAPVLFDHVIEYLLVTAAAVVVLVGLQARGPRPRPVAPRRRALEASAVFGAPWLLQQGVERGGYVAAAVVVGLLLGARRVVSLVAERRPAAFAVGVSVVLATAMPVSTDALRTERTFFGVARVEAEGDQHVLVHGTTIHGSQDRRPGQVTVPQSYYHPTSPIGEVFAVYGQRPVTDNVAILGLGTGALAGYGRDGQAFTFYEIDQAIVDIATDPQLFSYLSDTAADVDIVLGDGRSALADAPDRHYGIIVVDVFSSDAIPVHLLTAEAVQMYRSKLAPGGVLAFHTSNRHIDLEPVVAGVAAHLGLTGVVRSDAGDPVRGRLNWVVLAESAQVLESLGQRSPRPGRDDRVGGHDEAPQSASRGTWRPLTAETGHAPVWTDDFSDVVRVVRWR